MSVISSFAGGSPPGKSTSGLPACISLSLIWPSSGYATHPPYG
jgi:hypothetical protein